MSSPRSLLIMLFSAAFAGSILVACAGVSTTAGLVGGGLSLAGALVVFLLTAGAQSGCSPNVCLTMLGPDASRSVCLSDGSRLDVRDATDWDAGLRRDGPCLSDNGPYPDAAPERDGGLIDTDGPCLSDIGPLPDSGAQDAMSEPDASGDAEVLGAAGVPLTPLRREVSRRLALSGALPSDVARRLGVKTSEEEG